jgi:hypothetical protein
MPTIDTTAAAHVPNPRAEKRFAVAQVAAPLATAVTMPLLDTSAAGTVSFLLAVPALAAGANYMRLLPDDALDVTSCVPIANRSSCLRSPPRPLRRPRP